MRKVKAKVYVGTEKKEVFGLFHQWASDFEEFEGGPGNYVRALIELPDGKIVTALPTDVQFLDTF